MDVRLHPFGPPIEATLARDGGQLLLTWTAAEDDWVVIGDRSGAFASIEAGQTGLEALAGSTEVQDLLADHLVVSQDDVECPREWLPTRDLLGEGVRAAFVCPDVDEPVSLKIDVLTDVNAAYRTVLRTSGDDEVLFTASQPVHEVDTAGLEAVGAPVPGSVSMLLLLALAAGAALLGWTLLLRGTRRGSAGTATTVTP